MEGTAELAFGIAALVYAAGLALFRLPLLPVRRWGWTLMMHSWSGVAVLTVLGSFALLKGVMANYVSGLGYGWALTATFDDAIQSAVMARDMAFAWVDTVNTMAVALGSLMSIIMLALLPTWITGVGVLLSAIASFIISGVFGTLIFMQKVLAGVILFMEGVVAFVGLMKVLAPAMFTVGLVAFMIPFARRLGKTFMVMGAVFTIALPVAIVAAAPPPGFAEKRIMETADMQALGIASKAVADLQGGVRYTAYDRENDTIWYPFLLAEPLKTPEVDRDKVCGKIPRGANYTCEQLIAIVEEILKTPEKAVFDTGGGGYYNAYDEGYRTTLMNATYDRRVWFLNMWITLHDKGPKNITAYEIPSRPDSQAMECVMGGGWYDPGTWTTGHGGGLASSCENAYLMWRTRWENFWGSTNLYNETSEWMVAENRNSTFVWFTEQPWGTPKEDLNKYNVTVEKKREGHWEEQEEFPCETDGDSSTTETCTRTRYVTSAYYYGNKSVYFVYLNMSDWQVCWDADTTNIGHGGPGQICVTRKGSPDWSYRVYDFHGPINKYQPNQIDIRNETFRHNASIGGYECRVYWTEGVFDSHFEEIKKAGLIDDYGPYMLEQSIQSVDRNEPLVLDAPTEEKKVVVEVEVYCEAWSYAGYPILPEILVYEFRVDFEASESMPYLPRVDWSKFDDDERYQRELAAGKYVPDRITIGGASYGVENMRQEWSRYQNFRPGLYRDGPSQEASRRINAKLLEYKEESWETNATIFDTRIPIAKAVTDIIYKNAYGAYAGSNIPITSHSLLVTESGSIGILKPLSELIGTSFAMGFVIGLLALVVDTFNGLVGGQSVMMGFLMSKVGNISAAGRFFSQYLGAIQRMSHANMLGRYLARRMENQMLKAAFEQRWMNRQQWQKLAEQRKNVPFRIRMMEKVVGRERLDRMLDSRNPLAQMAARGYALSVAREGLRDAGFKQAIEKHMALDAMEKRGLLASKVNLTELAKQPLNTEFKTRMPKLETPESIKIDVEKTVRGLSQSGGARMTPEQWAEGFAAMMKNPNLTTLEKVTLLDSFARSNPGRGIVIADLAAPFGLLTEKIGEGVETLGARVGSERLLRAGEALEGFGRGFDGHITAPAAFQIGATEPWAEKGVHVTVPQGYVPNAGVDWHASGSPAEYVIRRDDAGGEYKDVTDAKGFVAAFGSSEDVKRFETNENLQHLAEAVTPPSDKFHDPFEAFKPSGAETVTVDTWVRVSPDDVRSLAESAPENLSDFARVSRVEADGIYVPTTYEVPSDQLHSFREQIESSGGRVEVNSVRAPVVEKDDYQPVRLDPINDNAWPEWMGPTDAYRASDYTDQGGVATGSLHDYSSVESIEPRGGETLATKDGKTVKGGDVNE